MSSYILEIKYADRPPETRTVTQNKLTIGRDVGDIVMREGAVSGRHGELNFDGASVTYQDLGSTNGSFDKANNRIFAPVKLMPGDFVRMGAGTLTVKQIGAAAAAAPPPGPAAAKGRTMMMQAPGRLPGMPPAPGAPPPPGMKPPGAPPPPGMRPPGAPPPAYPPAGQAPPPPGGAPPAPGGAPPAPGGFAPPAPGGFAPPPAPAAPPPGAPPAPAGGAPAKRTMMFNPGQAGPGMVPPPGAPPAPGGAPPAPGGFAPPPPGGAPPPPGGAPPAPGGYPPAAGGAPPAPGGYPPAPGMAPPPGGAPAPGMGQPGQPGMDPNQQQYGQPGQPGMDPNQQQYGQPGQPGQPGMDPSQQQYGQPGQPGMDPNQQQYGQPGQPGQPGMDPNQQFGQAPTGDPNQQYGQQPQQGMGAPGMGAPVQGGAGAPQDPPTDNLIESIKRAWNWMKPNLVPAVITAAAPGLLMAAVYFVFSLIPLGIFLILATWLISLPFQILVLPFVPAATAYFMIKARLGEPVGPKEAYLAVTKNLVGNWVQFVVTGLVMGITITFYGPFYLHKFMLEKKKMLDANKSAFEMNKELGWKPSINYIVIAVAIGIPVGILVGVFGAIGAAVYAPLGGGLGMIAQQFGNGATFALAMAAITLFYFDYNLARDPDFEDKARAMIAEFEGNALPAGFGTPDTFGQQPQGQPGMDPNQQQYGQPGQQQYGQPGQPGMDPNQQQYGQPGQQQYGQPGQPGMDPNQQQYGQPGQQQYGHPGMPPQGPPPGGYPPQ